MQDITVRIRPLLFNGLNKENVILNSHHISQLCIIKVAEFLKKEYDTICELGIGNKLTEIRYINARNPYYYFTMKDPDDNTIEITGPYDETDGELQ